MKQTPLWQLTATCSQEAERAVTDLLENIFGRPATVYIEAESKCCQVSIYCSNRREWTRTKRRQLRDGLKALQSAGLNIGAGKISFRKLRWKDWAEAWKSHFKPIEIGSSLLIKSSWSKRSPRNGQVAVVIDPGVSFGTGHHPTTIFCLEQLATCRLFGQPQSFLDIGTGSGILALAAAKCGYSPVHAIDLDPTAIRIARSNAATNGVLRHVRITHQDITKSSSIRPRKYDFICANLISDLPLRPSVLRL